MKDGREKTIQEYLRWLETYSWDWFATLKVTSGIPSKRRAEQLFDTWISSLREAAGDEGFRWFKVSESRPDGSNLHHHVLVGGLSSPRQLWQRRWSERGGDAVITTYDPDKEGILYLLKGTDSRGSLDCDFELPPAERSGNTDRGGAARYLAGNIGRTLGTVDRRVEVGKPNPHRPGAVGRTVIAASAAMPSEFFHQNFRTRKQ